MQLNRKSLQDVFKMALWSGAAALAAHRDGFLNRPFSLADPLWAHGYNPSSVLIAIGLVLAALCFCSLAATRWRARDLALLCAMLALVFILLPTGFVRKPPTL